MSNITAVKKLIKSVECVLDSYAIQLDRLSKGEEITNPIDDKTIDTVIKIVKEMTNFENFDRIANPQQARIDDKPVKTPIEQVSEQIKKNGRAN